MKNFITTLLLIGMLVAWRADAQSTASFTEQVLYRSPQLVVTQVAPHAYLHTSYKQTNDFGYVPCNGLVVMHQGESIVFDTPTTDSVSILLISWIKQQLHARIKAVIPTHFHDDCLGGLKAFHQASIPSYAYQKTIELAAANHFELPQHSFSDSLLLSIGDQQVISRYFGEGHTVDNVVGYFPTDQVLFGGCLIKELKASKGYLGDANVKEWSATVAKISTAYPHAQIIVPGHGTPGGQQLLAYTIQLFR